MALGDTGLTNLVLSGDLTVGGDATISGTTVLSGGELNKISETFDFEDCTDATTTGTYEFTVDIPAGAYVLATIIKDVTGFTGDTSATVTVGDGTDADRYMTGTPDVFTTADYIDAGVPSGAPFHAAAKTPTVIVTTNADFTSVTAGAMTVDIIYLT